MSAARILLPDPDQPATSRASPAKMRILRERDSYLLKRKRNANCP
uniref:Uncharacterized protein n=1 Tax=Plectus sambesii TaxID=2011161 RepID=A0A914V335_9BILA